MAGNPWHDHLGRFTSKDAAIGSYDQAVASAAARGDAEEVERLASERDEMIVQADPSSERGQKILQAQYGAMSSLKKPSPVREEKLVTKHGVEVVEGKIAPGDFIKGFNTKDSINGHYDGSWEDLNKLVEKHWEDNEPGTGSVDGDVLLVNVPKEGFYTNVVEITDENRNQVVTEEYVRKEGEKPVIARYITGEKPPAKHVQVVVYRADVLAQDEGRSTNAEWEMIAVLANKDKNTPMDPTTMARNNEHEEGGTYREYSDQEWADAHAYWDKHAYIKPPSD